MNYKGTGAGPGLHPPTVGVPDVLVKLELETDGESVLEDPGGEVGIGQHLEHGREENGMMRGEIPGLVKASW